jgi:Predicted transcriptional regulator
MKHVPLAASQENSSSAQNLQLVRLPRVLALTGVSTATWYRGISSGIYPAPVKIGSRAVAWRMVQAAFRIWTISPLLAVNGWAFAA